MLIRFSLCDSSRGPRLRPRSSRGQRRIRQRVHSCSGMRSADVHERFGQGGVVAPRTRILHLPVATRRWVQEAGFFVHSSTVSNVRTLKSRFRIRRFRFGSLSSGDYYCSARTHIVFDSKRQPNHYSMPWRHGKFSFRVVRTPSILLRTT